MREARQPAEAAGADRAESANASRFESLQARHVFHLLGGHPLTGKIFLHTGITIFWREEGQIRIIFLRGETRDPLSDPNKIRGVTINLPIRAGREKQMKRQSFIGVVALGALLVVFAGVSPAVGGENNLSGDERPVVEALETASPEITEWAAAWEYFDVVETGALPATVFEEPWMKEYGND